MEKLRFSRFLITVLALTAFLVGYLLLGEDIDSNPKTGTILDKFGEQTPDNNTSGTESEPSLPFLATEKRVISPTASNDKNSILYYEKGTGKIFEFNLDEKTERIISDTILPNFISSIWSPTKKEAVHSFYSQSGQDYRHYNLSTDEITRLDSNIRSVAFSSDGNTIVYFYSEGETADFGQPNSSESLTGDQTSLPIERIGKIVVSQTDGQYPKKILATRIKDLEVAWPAKDQIVLKTPDSGIYILTEEEKLTKFMEPAGLFQEEWSQSGKKMLFSALTDEKLEPLLWIKDLETREENPLDIKGNADKCVWSIDDITIICALMKSPSIDELYQINTLSGLKRLLAEPEVPIKELILSGTESYLLFTSALDEKLYGVKISDQALAQ